MWKEEQRKKEVISELREGLERIREVGGKDWIHLKHCLQCFEVRKKLTKTLQNTTTTTTTNNNNNNNNNRQQQQASYHYTRTISLGQVGIKWSLSIVLYISRKHEKKKPALNLRMPPISSYSITFKTFPKSIIVIISLTFLCVPIYIS